MVDKNYISVAVLKEPKRIGTKIRKGVLILSQVDYIVSKYPKIKELYYLVERRAWEGINDSKEADIKLVEDLSTWSKTHKLFPNALLLDIGPADFVDIESFCPLHTKKLYDGIQISSWNDFKRPRLFIEGVSLIPNRNFLKMGHFVRGGNEEERSLRGYCLKLSKKLGANIHYAYESTDSNKGRPSSKADINKIINQAKLGILTSCTEGINRFKMECLSADIPMLVPKDASHPTKKHINKQTGLLFEPTAEGLSDAIEIALKNREGFSPRSYVTSNTGIKISLDKLKKSLKTLCKRDMVHFDFYDIYWDGRNQSLCWGDNAEKLLRKSLSLI